MKNWLSELCGGAFMPHGQCYLWEPGLMGLHVVADSLIALSYYSIPLLILYFVRKRRDIPFPAIFLMFGAFIVACGTTHLLEVWTVWHPHYWLSGSVKAATALISLITAVALVRVTATDKGVGLNSLVPDEPLSVSANARALLSAERTALNLLGRLSGVATLTAAYVDAVAGTKARITDTRKTTPGLRALEKYAVRCGGALNHRFGLDDAILIKDNHIAACGGVGEAIRRARAFAGHLITGAGAGA
eukprot:gene54995-75355_t